MWRPWHHPDLEVYLSGSRWLGEHCSVSKQIKIHYLIKWFIYLKSSPKKLCLFYRLSSRKSSSSVWRGSIWRSIWRPISKSEKSEKKTKLWWQSARSVQDGDLLQEERSTLKTDKLLSLTLAFINSDHYSAFGQAPLSENALLACWSLQWMVFTE